MSARGKSKSLFGDPLDPITDQNQASMKVAFCPHSYFPSIGGAESYTRTLAEGLSKLGHEVTVVAPDVVSPEAFYAFGYGNTRRPSTETIDGVTIKRVSFVDLGYRFGRRGKQTRVLERSALRFRSRLLATLAEVEPDVVVTLPHAFPHVRFLSQVRSRSNWKLVYAPMLHEFDPYWSIPTVSELVGVADGLLALTEHERSRLLESYGAAYKPIAVVPPAVVSPHHRERQAARERFVLFVGRLAVSKRLPILRDAMTNVWERYPESRLVLAGAVDGDVPVDVEDPRIDLVANPSEEEKMALLERAAALASPSVNESFGIATLEAWAAGTPVVVADSPVNRSVVREGIDGLLADPDRPDRYAEAIIRILDDPDGAAAMGLAGHERLTAEFSPEVSAKKLERLLCQLL